MFIPTRTKRADLDLPAAGWALPALLLGVACAAGQGSPKPAAAEPAAPPPAQTSVAPPAPAPAESAGATTSSAPGSSAAASSDLLPATPRDSRSKEEIQRVIAAHRDQVRACYDAALANNPGIQGDLVIGFVINPDGSVKHAEVNWAESDLHVPELDACAVDVLGKLRFPPSSRGLESRVNYPFNFNPRK